MTTAVHATGAAGPSWIERIHGRYVHQRRVRVLREQIAALIPPGSTILDVGTGDGLLAQGVGIACGATITGIDTLRRSDCHIPVAEFDGRTIPYGDNAFDYVLFVDVLHHADDAKALLREATRVARSGIVIKDHLLQGVLANATLRFMDRTGNARHGVSLPYNYWTKAQWDAAFDELGLRPEIWKTRIGLYPPLLNLVFGRSLHFVARLRKSPRAADRR